MSKQFKIERTILLLSFGAGLCFALAEFFIAVYTHSQSVLMDAINDSIELLMIGLTLFLTPLFHKPITEKRPFGYSQIESVFIVIKSFMIIGVALSLAINSLNIAITGGNIVDGGQISFFQAILGSISAIILFIMMRLNKKISSPIVNVEIYGWRIDVFYSLGMAVAFFVSTFIDGTPFAFLLPYFDQIIAVLIIIFLLPEAVVMLFRAIKNVFLFSPEKETVERIKEISEEVLNPYPYEDLFFEVTRTGRRLWVSIYFSSSQDLVSMSALKQATAKLNACLAEEFPNCVVELIADV